MYKFQKITVKSGGKLREGWLIVDFKVTDSARDSEEGERRKNLIYPTVLLRPQRRQRRRPISLRDGPAADASYLQCNVVDGEWTL